MPIIFNLQNWCSETPLGLNPLVVPAKNFSSSIFRFWGRDTLGQTFWKMQPQLFGISSDKTFWNPNQSGYRENCKQRQCCIQVEIHQELNSVLFRFLKILSPLNTFPFFTILLSIKSVEIVHRQLAWPYQVDEAIFRFDIFLYYFANQVIGL